MIPRGFGGGSTASVTALSALPTWGVPCAEGGKGGRKAGRKEEQDRHSDRALALPVAVVAFWSCTSLTSSTCVSGHLIDGKTRSGGGKSITPSLTNRLS